MVSKKDKQIEQDWLEVERSFHRGLKGLPP
jgi:hypothetical protein